MLDLSSKTEFSTEAAMRLHRRIHAWARQALHQLFPAQCVGCDDYLPEDSLACRRCAHAVFPIDGPLCRVCGEPRPRAGGAYAGVDEICGRCLDRRPRFDSARACWEYAGVIADALQRAKYRGQLWAIRALAEELRPWLQERVARVGTSDEIFITTVPMHPSDLRDRGFNAAHLLARLALPGYAVRSDLLRKVVRTPAQAALSRQERVTNLKGAFECTEGSPIAGNVVVIFDDVMTTGATANEVARVMRSAGAREVVVLTAARAVAANYFAAD